MMCSKTVKLRLLANHLENVHNIKEKKLKQFCKLHLHGSKKFKEHLKKERKVEEQPRKRFSEKTQLLSRFQKSMQEQNLNMDVFTKMLMDVSMEYHGKRLGGDPREEKCINDAVNVSSNTLKMKINLKEKKVIDTSLPIPLSKVVDDTFDESLLKTEENKRVKQKPLKRLNKSVGPKMRTSTPKPRKNIPKVTSRSKGG